MPTLIPGPTEGGRPGVGASAGSARQGRARQHLAQVVGDDPQPAAAVVEGEAEMAGVLAGAALAEGGDAAVLDHGRHLRSEEHTSELQSRENLVCRLLLEKKKQI